MQIVDPSAFGTLVKGGPLASFNYNWVMSSNRVFQFVGSFMFNKPNDSAAERQHGTRPDEDHSEQPDGQHPRQPDDDRARRRLRRHRHLAPLDDLPVAVDDVGRESLGAHEFRGGADLYPNIANETSTRRRRRSSSISVRRAPPAARTCSSSATSCAASTAASSRRQQGVRARTTAPTSRIAGSRRRSVVDQGRGARREQQNLHAGSRESARRAAASPALPTNIADRGVPSDA